MLACQDFSANLMQNPCGQAKNWFDCVVFEVLAEEISILRTAMMWVGIKEKDDLTAVQTISLMSGNIKSLSAFLRDNCYIPSLQAAMYAEWLVVDQKVTAAIPRLAV